MLDAGFENDIRRIIAHCPDKTNGRQTVMCEFHMILSPSQVNADLPSLCDMARLGQAFGCYVLERSCSYHCRI